MSRPRKAAVAGHWGGGPDPGIVVGRIGEAVEEVGRVMGALSVFWTAVSIQIRLILVNINSDGHYHISDMISVALPYCTIQSMNRDLVRPAPATCGGKATGIISEI